MWLSVSKDEGRLHDIFSALIVGLVSQILFNSFPVCRRTLENVQGVQQIPLDEALSRSDVQVAFLCTENASHEEYIR